MEIVVSRVELNTKDTKDTKDAKLRIVGLPIRLEAVGKDTTLARIGRLVAEAKRRRPPLVRMADRLSGIFLPVILMSVVGVYLETMDEVLPKIDKTIVGADPTSVDLQFVGKK